MTDPISHLQTLGLRVRIGPRGTLQAGPPSALTHEARAFLAARREDLLDALRPRRAWRVTLANGTRVVAIRPAGATRSDILSTVADQFGQVIGIEPAEARQS